MFMCSIRILFLAFLLNAFSLRSFLLFSLLLFSRPFSFPRLSRVPSAPLPLSPALLALLRSPFLFTLFSEPLFFFLLLPFFFSSTFFSVALLTCLVLLSSSLVSYSFCFALTLEVLLLLPFFPFLFQPHALSQLLVNPLHLGAWFTPKFSQQPQSLFLFLTVLSSSALLLIFSSLFLLFRDCHGLGV